MPWYRQGEPTVAGETARDFELELGGRAAHLTDLKGAGRLEFLGDVVPGVRRGDPALNKLPKYVAPRNGVILGVAADEDPAVYEEFLRDQNVIFLTYRDPSTQGHQSPIGLPYGTSMYPETYIIDRRGKIARKFISVQQWDSPDMLAYFDYILGQN